MALQAGGRAPEPLRPQPSRLPQRDAVERDGRGLDHPADLAGRVVAARVEVQPARVVEDVVGPAIRVFRRGGALRAGRVQPRVPGMHGVRLDAEARGDARVVRAHGPRRTALEADDPAALDRRRHRLLDPQPGRLVGARAGRGQVARQDDSSPHAPRADRGRDAEREAHGRDVGRRGGPGRRAGEARAERAGDLDPGRGAEGVVDRRLQRRHRGVRRAPVRARERLAVARVAHHDAAARTARLEAPLVADAREEDDVGRLGRPLVPAARSADADDRGREPDAARDVGERFGEALVVPAERGVLGDDQHLVAGLEAAGGEQVQRAVAQLRTRFALRLRPSLAHSRPARSR